MTYGVSNSLRVRLLIMKVKLNHFKLDEISRSAPTMVMFKPMSGKLGKGLKWQVPSFIAVGLFGFVVDSAVTVIAVRTFDVDPLVARLPAFGIATLLNFGLNRRLTFHATSVPLWAAFHRYLMVCAAGFCVNYLAYIIALKSVLGLGFEVSAPYLPIFVAWGAGWAMFVTFFGYRRFAFRL